MAEERRHALMNLLQCAERPLKGMELAEKLGVSRQVIVQDIAILRASGEAILSTSSGYLLNFKKKNKLIRTIVSKHSTFEEMAEELYTIVDFGAKVLDVIVEHPIYGEIVGNLVLGTREEVHAFIEQIKENEAQPLSSLTQGEHIHSIEVPSEKIFDLLIEELRKKGLAEE